MCSYFSWLFHANIVINLADDTYGLRRIVVGGFARILQTHVALKSKLLADAKTDLESLLDI